MNQVVVSNCTGVVDDIHAKEKTIAANQTATFSFMVVVRSMNAAMYQCTGRRFQCFPLLPQRLFQCFA